MKRHATTKALGTDLKRLAALPDEEIDTSEIPEITPEQFARGVVRRGLHAAPLRKALVTLRVDREVLDWFRLEGRGYQTRINALLRAYMEARKKGAA